MIKKMLLSCLFCFLMVGSVSAVDNLVIRLEEPKTPTNQNNFPITFVVLDLVGGRDISVVCNKQYEGGSVATYDSHALSAGGNTDSCQVTSDVIKDKGTYQFSVTATAGSDTASDVVTVAYNNETPGDPRDYNKSKHDACSYEIKFKTADDNGKTAKVELYRAETTSYTADDGSRIESVTVGSNTEKSIITTLPDCNKTYYYAIRAFSSSGNGSGIVSDAETKVVSSTVTSTITQSTAQGAIPVRRSSILGVENKAEIATPAAAASESGAILGETGEIGTEATPAGTIFTRIPALKWVIGIGIVLLLGLWFVRKRQ